MFRPRADYILVKPLERVASSIIDVVLHELPNLGVVIAIGPGKIDKRGQRRRLDVKIGDTVRFGEFNGMFPEYIDNGVRHLIVQEADIAGVLETETA